MTNRFERGSGLGIPETYRAFFEGLKSNSLEELAKIAYRVFGLPLVLHDENSRLLCQYPQIPLGEKMWDIILEEKNPQADLLQEYQRNMLSDKPVDFEPFYYQPEDPEESRYILGQVYDRERNYGYFTIFLLDNPLEEEDLARARIFSEALLVVMNHLNTRNRQSLLTALSDALEDEPGSARWVKAIAALERNIRGNYAVAALPVGGWTSQKTYAAMAIRWLPPELPAIIHDGSIILLMGDLPSADPREKIEGTLAEVERLLKPSGETCGVSAPFANLEKIGGHVQQACMTALCVREGTAFYEDLAPAPIFQFAARYGKGEAFLAPVLRTIAVYDRENKTDYFETLRAYSLFLHNKERAAQELCIHRNTLLYRLNRIEEIFGIPYEEPQTALHLLNSFQLWDVMKGM